jgi:DNA invertase Pin-like site-specific DNA recombinase
LENLGDRLKIG